MKYMDLRGLPKFKKYELIDLEENTWEAALATGFFKGRGYRDEKSLYIKGIDKICDKDQQMFDYEYFFKDYFKLGKKLFELAISKNKMIFTNTLDFEDDSDIERKYVDENMLYQDLYGKYVGLLDEIDELTSDIASSAETEEYKLYASNLNLKVNDITNTLTVLYGVFEYDVNEQLHALSDFLYDYRDDIENSKIKEEDLKNCKYDALDYLITEINKIKIKNNFNLKKELALSGAKSRVNYKMNCVDLYNYFKKSPIEIRFTYYQLKDLKKIVIPWLNKYGFPYFVKKEIEDNYRNEIKKINEKVLEHNELIKKNFPNEEQQRKMLNKFYVSDNECVMPCEYLIQNSIYHYLFYSILKYQQEADEKVKKIFGVTGKLSQKKIKEIKYLQTCYKYYFYNVCDNIFGINLRYNENKDEFYIENDEDIEDCQNIFLKGSKNDYHTYYFNNMCIAANMWLEKDTKNIEINKKKYCCICKKWKEPSEFKYKKYCSDECKEKGNKKKDADRKRKNYKK